MTKLVKVLSIDGGGIRGIIPAMVLSEIEVRTGKRIAELFDLIAGSSTGGILALGLTKPNAQGKPEYTARDIVNLYKDKGKVIFPSNVFRRIKSFVNEKYSAVTIEKVLDSYFGETKLSKALAEVIVTSYDLYQRNTFFFKRSKARQDPNRDFKMKDVARATTAAPTYFEPLELKAGDRTFVLVDGGLFANNPSMSAYVEAKNLNKDATDFLVVSIGTGQLANRLEYKQTKDWGMIEWAQPILNVVFDGVSDCVDYQMNELLSKEDGSTSYYRFQIDLHALRKDRGDRIDDASDENLEYLEHLAQKIITTEDQELNAVCQLLTAKSFNSCEF